MQNSFASHRAYGDEFNHRIHSLVLAVEDVAVHLLFTFVKSYGIPGPVHIRSRICHFSGTIYDTSHDADFFTFQMIGTGTDFRCRFL